jgi:hypothetical protein
MEEIARYVGRELKWSQSGATAYELRSDGHLIATLRFKSMWGTLATAESGDGCWTFKRVGFWQSKASIRVCGTGIDVAAFRNNTWASGGTLEFPDGRRYRATTNFWMTRLAFQTEVDEPVVHFRYGGLFRRSADVEMSPSTSTVSDVALLVLFGWYLAIMLESDAAAAGAAT